ncbi:MAG: hypothetical protein IPG55_16800 [Saprospiraceae bacterium]|nr:hypothetical protein [Candidatus Defluviibacterium haderslevense]
MAKRIKSQVEKIRDLLVNQPFEEVYSIHFANKQITKELFDVFFDSFDSNNLKTSEYNSKKIDLLKEWVGLKYNRGLRLNKFPSFVDFYIEQFYRDDGLRYVNYPGNILVLEKELEQGENFEEYVFNFEFQLVTKDWWSAEDHKIWIDLQRKRMVVKDFEPYILDLENELNETFLNDEEFNFEGNKKIYQEHIDNIKIEIARIKLFKKDINKVSILENLINYFEALEKNDHHYLFVVNQEDDKQVKAEQTLKLNLLHQFGIIEFLNRVWKTNNIPKPLEFLLATLINEKNTSIQPRLSKQDDPKLRNTTSNNKLENYLKDFDLEPDKIKRP